MYNHNMKQRWKDAAEWQALLTKKEAEIASLNWQQRGPAEAQRRRARRGKEEQGSVCSFRRRRKRN